MNKRIETYAALALSMAAIAGYVPKSCFSKQKIANKCLLPDCEIMTSHRGGYCCAEHCKKHKQTQRSDR